MSLYSAESGRRFTDTDLRLAEELAQRASAAIENALYFRAAEDANQAKDDFLAVVSHELRTPLNAILGWVHMLRQEALPEAQSARALETIERNARAQNQLIEDLLDVSRIVSGKLRLDAESVDLPQVIERAIDTLGPAAASKGVRITPELDRHASPVMGDPARLQQVVGNLLSNALKFSNRDAEVHVALRKLESAVEIIVQDQGQGIDPDFLPHVFERFRQADARTTRSRGGLGLGLAIVRNLVELHGGSVRAESKGRGCGATFTVCLPVTTSRTLSFARPPALHLTPAAPAAHSTPELQGIRVLVVDDEDDARDVVAALLAASRMQVSTASSVTEAMRKVAEFHPDIIISDIGMPGEDGYALMKRLRALPANEGGKTPAVALTAYARREERTRALVSGFNMHVPKPVEPAELLAALVSLTSVFQQP
jgi:CheY-like chemotaxis protein/nitrogen-specific signal transduction histidine kinase